jgi:shikimate kinase
MSNRSLLFLIGARGTGKTTTAEHLAARLGWAWCDADVLLEQRAGKTIRQIFADDGETAFRDHESALLRELATWQNHVIATGGGLVLRPENRALLKHGIVVWLRAAADVLWQRLQQDAAGAARRPNLAQGGLVEIEAVLATRTALYEACADWHIATDHLSPHAVAERIAAWLHGEA